MHRVRVVWADLQTQEHGERPADCADCFEADPLVKASRVVVRLNAEAERGQPGAACLYDKSV